MKYDEKRDFMRTNLDSEMHYRQVDSNQFNLAKCISLSGAGVSFITSIICYEGEALEIKIPPQNAITHVLTAFVQVIRVTLLVENKYEIATLIKTIKG
ncbi:MAG: hypothetical protein RL236_1824 [Pseudomonadota bacterium]|jgi:hypothetical protein